MKVRKPFTKIVMLLLYCIPPHRESSFGLSLAGSLKYLRNGLPDFLTSGLSHFLLLVSRNYLKFAL